MGLIRTYMKFHRWHKRSIKSRPSKKIYKTRTRGRGYLTSRNTGHGLRHSSERWLG